MPNFKFPGMPDFTKLEVIYEKIKPLLSIKTLLIVPILFLYLFVGGLIFYSFESIILVGLIIFILIKVLW